MLVFKTLFIRSWYHFMWSYSSVHVTCLLISSEIKTFHAYLVISDSQLIKDTSFTSTRDKSKESKTKIDTLPLWGRMEEMQGTKDHKQTETKMTEHLSNMWYTTTKPPPSLPSYTFFSRSNRRGKKWCHHSVIFVKVWYVSYLERGKTIIIPCRINGKSVWSI